MSARSRKPDTESFGIESSSVLASSRLQTGVLPFLTTYFGPRTACAGFDGVICRTTRKSGDGQGTAKLLLCELFGDPLNHRRRQVPQPFDFKNEFYLSQKAIEFSGR